MTKRDILDVRKKHAGGRPTGPTPKSKRIAELFEQEVARRTAWRQPVGNKTIAAAITASGERFGWAIRTDQQGRTVPGPDAGWRVNPIHAEMLAEEIAQRLDIMPSYKTPESVLAALEKHQDRVLEELDRLVSDAESRKLYFEYDPDLEYDTKLRPHSAGAVVGIIKRHKSEHPEFKTRKRAGSKAKPPKP